MFFDIPFLSRFQKWEYTKMYNTNYNNTYKTSKYQKVLRIYFILFPMEFVKHRHTIQFRKVQLSWKSGKIDQEILRPKTA